MDPDLLRAVVEALDRAGIPHMVVGSVAGAYHGEPRMTRDIDFVIDPEPTAVVQLVNSFPTDRFYCDDAEAAVAARGMFNVIDVGSGWKADLIVRKDREYSREEFRRRLPAMLSGVATHVATVEDTILSKLEWRLQSRSDTQRRDVVEMLDANWEYVDRAYLERWAGELGVGNDLDELVEEVRRRRE